MAAKAHDSENYSRLELDDRFLHTAKYLVPNTDVSASPQVYDDNLPEVHQTRDEGFVALPGPNPKTTRTRCGIRRRRFWILFGVLAVIVIAAAVGGGLGSRSQRSGPSSQPSQSTPRNPKDVLPETKLAAFNITDVHGHSNYFVYYQKNSNELFESAYNSSLGRWTASRVGNESDTFRRGTQMSANIHRFDSAARNMHIYAVDEDGYLTGRIRHTNDTSQSVEQWKRVLRKSAAPLNGSKIVSYGRENEMFLTKNIVFFQEGDGETLFTEFMGGPTDEEKGGRVVLTRQHIPRAGFALVPIQGGKDANLSLAMFDIVAGGKSPRYVNLSVYKLGDVEQNVWEETDISGQYDLNESASIAGFSVGASVTGDVRRGSGDDLTVHLLILEPGQTLSTVSFMNGNTTDGGLVKGMGTDKLLSMAACQGQRVYGTVDKGDGTVKIMEWEWVSDNQYKEVGEVNTTMEEG